MAMATRLLRGVIMPLVRIFRSLASVTVAVALVMSLPYEAMPHARVKPGKPPAPQLFGAWCRTRVTGSHVTAYCHNPYPQTDGVSLHVFNVRDGGDLKVEIPNVQGQTAATFHCTRRGKTLRITGESTLGAWSVQVRGAGAPAAVQAQSNEIQIELES
jgi:hypothetical protein